MSDLSSCFVSVSYCGVYEIDGVPSHEIFAWLKIFACLLSSETETLNSYGRQRLLLSDCIGTQADRTGEGRRHLGFLTSSSSSLLPSQVFLLEGPLPTQLIFAVV